MRRANLASTLGSLRDEDPKNSVSLVRLAWPDIKAALDRGHSVKVIHERFVMGGVAISYRLFALYVGQLRREEAPKNVVSLAKARIEDAIGPGTGNNMNGETDVALVRLPKRRLFSAKAAAQYLGIHEQTLKRITEEGCLPARRLGSRRVYKLEDLDAYIESLPACFTQPRS